MSHSCYTSKNRVSEWKQAQVETKCSYNSRDWNELHVGCGGLWKARDSLKAHVHVHICDYICFKTHIHCFSRCHTYATDCVQINITHLYNLPVASLGGVGGCQYEFSSLSNHACMVTHVVAVPETTRCNFRQPEIHNFSGGISKLASNVP